MSFKDTLQKEITQLETNTGGGDFDKVEHPSSTIKNDMLYLNKDTTEQLVRVLPPKSMDDGFGVGFRRMFFDVTNAAGKHINSPMVLPLQAQPDKYMLDQRVNNWVENGTMPGQYPTTRPQTRYYLNVVRLNPVGGGQYEHATNQDGSPMVQVLELPVTAYKGIVNDLVDANIVDPEGSGDFGAISATNAYPIKIYRTGQGLKTEYNVRTYEHPLGPLANGWENELEDLNYLATPSEEYNEEFVHYMIAVHEGREQEFNSDRGQGGGDTSTAPAAPTQNQGFNNQQPATPPPAQNQGFNQQPAQNQGFNQQPTVSDEDMGHFPPKGNQPATPPPAQNGFGQPNQGAPTTPPAQEGNTTPPASGGMADVNDLLAQVKKEADSQ